MKSEPARVSDKLELDFNEFNDTDDTDEINADAPSPEPEASYEGDAERPFVADPMMPGGMIWPPVDGRALLHEVSGLGIRPTRTPRGDWVGLGLRLGAFTHGRVPSTTTSFRRATSSSRGLACTRRTRTRSPWDAR